MDPLRFATKARTLEQAADVVENAVVLPQVRIEAARWRADRQLTEHERLIVAEWILDGGVIVRSSAAAEDAAGESLAGHFTSVAGVDTADALASALDQVVDSYGEPSPRDEVFVQPMLSGVAAAGVAFTRDPSTGGHYSVVSFDESGATDTVTGGTGESTTLYLSRTHPWDADRFPGWVPRLVDLLDELIDRFDHDRLDVEFAVDADGELYLLQVRPLTMADAAAGLAVDHHRRVLDRIADRVQGLAQPHPYLRGRRSVFGVMPDWNPAEIVGVRPRSLALSLYKELVTDAIWAYQRDNYGYRNLRSFPLIVSFAGLPYVDVRVSFNSFVPADLDDELADRLVDHYIDRLVERPSDHDKVEFEIIHSCYTFDIDDRLAGLGDHGFGENERARIRSSLRALTNRIIHRDSGLWRRDIDKIDELRRRQDTVMSSDLDPIGKIYWLLEDCKRYGTLPFAGLARAGFIAVQLLRSMVGTGVLTAEELDDFMASLETVSSEMATDLERLQRDAFLGVYGHLRPGTYDILSPRYDETPDRYFAAIDDLRSGGGVIDLSSGSHEFRLGLAQLDRLESLLRHHEIDHDVLSIFGFIKAAIEGRERAKFVFTKSLSDALELLRRVGEDLGFTRDDISYCDIDVIRSLYTCAEDPRAVIAASIERGRATFAETSSIVLPSLITDPEDVTAFRLPDNEPNFVTLRSTRAKVVSSVDEAVDLRGSIVFIPNADPGFDWVFTHNIAGLVTEYGGTNSHMAIRAAELGIPAIIGAGTRLYSQWSAAAELEIDCANHIVRSV